MLLKNTKALKVLFFTSLSFFLMASGILIYKYFVSNEMDSILSNKKPLYLYLKNWKSKDGYVNFYLPQKYDKYEEKLQ